MSDSSIGIVGQWFRERRDLARARASAADVGRPESIEQHAWRGLDTTTRDLAVEASVLGQLADVLRTSTEAGLRAGRYGDRDRIGGAQAISALGWQQAVSAGFSRRALLVAIEHLLDEAQLEGADLGDLTITVSPGRLEQVGVEVRLEGVRR